MIENAGCKPAQWVVDFNATGQKTFYTQCEGKKYYYKQISKENVFCLPLALVPLKFEALGFTLLSFRLKSLLQRSPLPPQTSDLHPASSFELNL